MIPDSFFLLRIESNRIHTHITVGPYSTFQEASTIALDYLEIVLLMNGLRLTDEDTVSTKILECAHFEDHIEVILERGTDVR